MSSTIANGHSELNGLLEDSNNTSNDESTASSSSPQQDSDSSLKKPEQNGLGYSPHVARKPVLLDSSNTNCEFECNTKTSVHLHTSTSVERELVNHSVEESDLPGEATEVATTRVVKTTTLITSTTVVSSNTEGDTSNTSSIENHDFTGPDSEVEKISGNDIEQSPEQKKSSPSLTPDSSKRLVVRPSKYEIAEVGDRLKIAESLISTIPDQPVLLRYQKTGALSDPPTLITTMLERTVAKFPQLTALAVKRNNEWKKWSFSEMMAEIRAVAKAFISLGLQRYHGVGILGFNSPEWFISNFAAIYAGGLSTGIYATNNPEACEWPLADCKANICVVENDKQLEKILKIWPNLPELKAVIQWTGKPTGHPNVFSWADIVELGRTLPSSDLDARIADLAANQCSTLIYTSGTTGNPKGVMLSHDNLTWTAAQCAKMAESKPGEEYCVSYLPLSHIAAQIIDMYIPFTVGASVYVAQPDALRGSLVTTLQEIRPTILLGVPRVWEKIQEKMVELGSQAPSLKRSFVRWAKTIGMKGVQALDNGQELPFGWNVANNLVFKKVKVALGLDRCRLMFTGAAPIMLETLEFFRSLNIRILDAYGMSECSAPHTIQWPLYYKFGSSGRPIPGAITHIHNPEEDGTGEICMEGRHVFMGYLYNEEKTAEALDEHGWLHSGDVGKVDKDGYLFITGRIKELIITAGGENVPPVPIEDALKSELPALSQVMLIGDRRKFLSVLLTLKVEVDPETMVPKDKLAHVAQQWVASLGSTSTKVTEILDKTDLPVLKAIQAAIDRVNERATSNAQKIQKWTLLPRDFSIPGGELGPTMKVRRPIVAKMYKETIESFYDLPEGK